jgi:hypothetical protein
MKTKIFDMRALDMASAYDWSQGDAIRHGDVMLVADGVAVLCEAWPVMVAGASDVFHRLADGATWERFALDCPRPGMAEQLLAGVAVAQRPLADLVAAAAQAAERDRRLATLDYPEHELAAIRSAQAATRCAA